MPQIDYYRILQLDPEAEQEIVKVVYRKLSLKYHPDGAAPDPDKMRLLNEANEVIGDEARRKRYDAHRLHERDLPDSPLWATRPPSYWRPPTEPISSARPTPRRRFRYGLAPGTFTIFGTLAVLTFLAVVIQALLSGTERAVSSLAPTATLEPERIPVFVTSALAAESRLEEMGFLFPEIAGSDGEIGGTNDATNSLATIAAEGENLKWIILKIKRNGETMSETREAQDEQIDAMLAIVLANEAARQQIATWIDGWDQLEPNRAEFQVEGVNLAVMAEPIAGVISIEATPLQQDSSLP